LFRLNCRRKVHCAYIWAPAIRLLQSGKRLSIDVKDLKSLWQRFC
jgi:hypothetical protein